MISNHHVVPMNNTVCAILNVQEHVPIEVNFQNYAIICVMLDVFAKVVMFDNSIKTVHAFEKANVNRNIKK